MSSMWNSTTPIRGSRISAAINWCATTSITLFRKEPLLQSNAFLVVAAVPADIQAVYGINNVIGPYTGTFKKTETLELLMNRGPCC